MLQPILSRDRILLPFEGKIKAMWPRAPHLEFEKQQWAVLQDGPREHIALAAAGYKLPSPILRHYDWEDADPPPFETQKQTAALLSSNRRAYCLSDMGCVSADTEYLSETGWRRIDRYAGERVAQYDPKDESIAFVEPEYIKLPCEQMIRFKTTRGVDQLLSP